MLLPAMMIVTARIINNIPQPILGVKVSPNTATPKNTAVTGSSAPSMAVGVEPIYWTALVVQRNEMAEGKAAERTDITFLQKLPLFQKGKESYEPVD